MDLKEALNNLESLGKALPSILELALPLQQYEDLVRLQRKIDDAKGELAGVSGALETAQKALAQAQASSEASLKASAELASSIADRAFQSSKPRREEILAQLQDLENQRMESSNQLRELNVAVDDKKGELEAIKQSIASVKADALKALGV